MSENDPEFPRENWALYASGAAVLLVRFAVRIRTVGFRNFEGDDLFSFIALLLLTMDGILVNALYYYDTNVEAAVILRTRALTQAEIHRYTIGSKVQLAAWYSYTGIIWCMKGTMVCFFRRLTTGLTWQSRYVKWLGIACGLAYIPVFFTITLGCFPMQRNWQVSPDPGPLCTLKIQNFLVTVILNVITDAAILAVPLPLLWKLQIPLQKKMFIAALLGSGLFVISAAIIRVAITLGARPSTLNIDRWGVRETIVGIAAVNIPILRPLFVSSFWTYGPYQLSSHTPSTGQVHYGSSGNFLMTRISKMKNELWSEEAPNSDVKLVDNDNRSEEIFEPRRSSGDSRERIIQEMADKSGVVKVETSYEVSSKGQDEASNWTYGIGERLSRASIRAGALA